MKAFGGGLVHRIFVQDHESTVEAKRLAAIIAAREEARSRSELSMKHRLVYANVALEALLGEEDVVLFTCELDGDCPGACSDRHMAAAVDDHLVDCFADRFSRPDFRLPEIAIVRSGPGFNQTVHYPSGATVVYHSVHPVDPVVKPGDLVLLEFITAARRRFVRALEWAGKASSKSYSSDPSSKFVQNAVVRAIEFGLDTEYGHIAPVDLTEPALRTPILGIKPDSEYHLRVRGFAGGSTCTGDDFTLTTGSVPANLSDKVKRDSLSLARPMLSHRIPGRSYMPSWDTEALHPMRTRIATSKLGTNLHHPGTWTSTFYCDVLWHVIAIGQWVSDNTLKVRTARK